MSQLDLYDRVSVDSLLSHFASRNTINGRIPLRESADGREYLRLLDWLVFNRNEQLALEGNWIVRRRPGGPIPWPPPHAGAPKEPRPLVRA